MKALSKLICIGCGLERSLAEETQFLCPKCGDLFDVVPDLSGFKRCLADWAAIFNSRRQLVRCPSGVWRFREWIAPGLEESEIVSLGEGNVPIVPAGRNLRDWIGGDIDLWLMLQGKNPTGAFKDQGMTAWASVAKALGKRAGVASSTGDTSASMAAYCAKASIQCSVCLPDGEVTDEQILQLKMFGAKVILLPGDFDACMAAVLELVERYGAYPANSVNPMRIEGHQSTVFLAAQFFNWQLPDWFVVPVGNGSNSSSIGKGLRLMKQLGFPGNSSSILGCQSEAANPMVLSWQRAGELAATIEGWEAEYQPITVGKTIATAARIGNPVSWKKVIREVIGSNGAMAQASEADLTEAALVCSSDGYWVCPQTGQALAGLREAVRKGWIRSKQRVVVISTADGGKFGGTYSAICSGDITRVNDCQAKTVAEILGLA